MEAKVFSHDVSDVRISVAMATYNGEKYIEEQLRSICCQTRKPDEIVISDDGSKDATLEIVKQVAKSEDAQGIDFVVLTDNPRHGYCGNFEWAIKHTTGDYVFLSDQDDIWREDKVIQTILVVQKHPDAQCICHNAQLVGKQGEPLDGIFDDRFRHEKLNILQGRSVKIDRESFLADTVSWGGIHGMSMCISRQLIVDMLPFPLTKGSHDKWITLCAVLNDAMYFLNAPLAYYRLHGNNTCGNSAYRGNVLDRVKKKWKNLKSNKGDYTTNYIMGIAIRDRLISRGYGDHPACITANRLIEIGKKTYDAETSGRITGAIKLIKLFCTDIRYRRSGSGAFIQQLVYIIRNSKKQRIENAGGGIK